ncbi:hypothetical protein RHECNPAF_4460014 [Rhizobium etli CNPAF512]|nr:hypothetical protein RHECNPAF_4460014 [Rhizobium etli CNPAF512]
MERDWREPSSVSRPRVERPVEKIGQKVDADENRADDDRAAEHGVHVGILQRIGDVEPDARPGEDGFGQNRSFEQAGIGKRDDGDERHGGIAQRMPPDHPGFGQPFGARGDDIFLRQLVQHEAAGHAANIGEREITEQRGGQDDVAEDVVEHVPLPLPGAVEQIKTGDRRERIFEDDVDAAGKGHPAQLRIEDDERNQRQPEDRHRITDQADDAHHLVGDAAAAHGGENAERHTDAGADQRSERRELDRRRHDAADIDHDGVGGQHRIAEIAGQDAFDIDEKLLVERQIEAHFLAHTLDDMGGRAVAEDGEHGIDRHDPADEEGDGQKTEISGDGGEQEASRRLGESAGTALSGPRRHLCCFDGAQAINPAGSFLGDRPDEIGIEARTQLEVLQVLAIAGHLGLLEDDDEGAVGEELLLDILVHGSALLTVALKQRGLGFLVEFRRFPGVAPGERLHRAGIGIVGVAGEGVGIGIRVEIVRAPVADIDVVGAGAIFGQRLLAVARDDFQLYASLRQRLLHGFSDTGHRLRVAHVHGHGKAVRHAGLGKQLLGLGDIELVGVFIKRAELALRQEGLMDLADTLDQRCADRIVVDQIFEGLLDFRLLQVLVLAVQADVINRALRRAGRREIGVLGKGVDVARLEIAGNVDIAGFERQPLGRAFLHVAVDDAIELRLVAVIIVVALQHDDFVGSPFAQLEGAGTGIAGFQPLIAEIIVVFVLGIRRYRLHMLLHELFVDHGGDRRRQTVEHEARRIGLVDREDECVGIGRLGLFGDIVAGQTELGKDEGRALVELDGALERPCNVFSGNRISRCEFEARFQLERIGEAVIRNAPALGKIALHLRCVGEIETNEQTVAVAGDLCG